MNTPSPPTFTPLISVVTAVYNGARTLEATIDSVARQTFRDFEYLIQDGGSTDGTVAVVEKRRAEVTHWVSERDSGIYNAWNRAVARARGQWIAFLGADDEYLPDALETYAQHIRSARCGELHYLSSRVELVKNGHAVRTIGTAWSWPAFSRYMTVAHVGSMHHRSLFDQYGLFDESYRMCADYEMLLRPRERLRAGFVDRVTARMALGGASNNNVRAALLEQERAKRTTGGRSALLCSLERTTAHIKDRCRALVWY